MWTLLLAACWTPAPGLARLEVAAAPVRTWQGAGSPRVAIYVRAGSAHDPPGQEGLAWLTAHWTMLAPEVDRAVLAAGATAEVDVGPELVRFEVTGADPVALSTAAQAVAHALVEPSFEPLILSALQRTLHDGPTLEATPGSVLLDWLHTGHPYGHAPHGTRASVQAQGPLQVQAFHDRRYIRSATAIVAQGLEPAQVEQLRAALDAMPPRPYEDVTPRALEMPGGTEVVLIRAAEGATGFALGWPLPVPAHDARVDQLEALARDWSGPEGSLVGDLVQKRNLAASVSAGARAGAADPGAVVQLPFMIVVRGVPDDALTFALRAVLWSLDGLRSAPPAPAVDAGPPSPDDEAARALLASGPWPPAQAQANATDALHLLPPDRVRIVVATTDPDTLRQALLEEKVASAVSTIGTFPEEDASIIRYPLVPSTVTVLDEETP